MAVVTYLLRADLRKRWRALALLALLVAVVVAGVLSAAAGARRTRTAFDRYLEEVRPVDALASSEGPPPEAATVEQVPGVAAAVGYRWYAVFPVGGPDGIYFIPLFVPSDHRVPDTLERSPVVEGRAPDPDAPLEIALGEHTARRLGVGVGGSVPAVSYTPDQAASGAFEAPAGPELSFDVVGIVRTPSDVTARESDVDPNLLTPAFASTYGDEIGLFGAGLMVAVEPGASVDRVGQAMASLHGNLTFETSFGRAVNRAQADPTLAAMATGLRVVALILAIAGAVVVVQSLARAATDRLRGQEGLRALGATRSTRLLQLGLPSLLAVGVGVGVGGILSVALSPFVLWGLARRAEPDPGLRIDAAVLGVGMLAAFVLLCIAIAGVTWAAIRRDALRHSSVVRTSTTARRAASLGGSVPVVTGLRLALERGRGARTTPVVAAAVAAALGGMGVMATIVFAGSLHHATTTPSVYGWDFDGVLMGSDNGDDFGSFAGRAATADAMADDPSLTAVAEIINDLEITANGVPNRAWVLQDLKGHSSFVTVRGREAVGPDEVEVAADTLDQLGLELGDPVEIAAGGPARTLTIVGVTTLPVTEDGGSNSIGLAMRSVAADALGFGGSCEEAECSHYLGVSARPGTAITTAVKPYVSDEVSFAAPAPPAQIERLSAVDQLPRAVAVALGLLAILAVSYASSATVRRRRRDLAMLRVWGLPSRQLRRVVTIQVAVLALGGAVVGAVLGVALGRLLWTAVAESVPLPVAIDYPAAAIVLVPAVIAALAQVGASLARRSAGRVRPATALRAE
jgi:hypothetical protein